MATDSTGDRFQVAAVALEAEAAVLLDMAESKRSSAGGILEAAMVWDASTAVQRASALRLEAAGLRR